MNEIMLLYPSNSVNEELIRITPEISKRVYDNARFQYTDVKIMSLIRENVIAVIA